MMAAKIVLLLILLCIQVFMAHANTCDRCNYWNTKAQMCVKCPPRTYQPDFHYSGIDCIPWTKKPFGENWTLATAGTQCKDQVWECDEGFFEVQLSKSIKVCRKITTIRPSTSAPSQNSSETVSNTTLKPESTTKSTAKFKDDDDGVENWIIAVITIVFVFLLVLVLIFCLWRKKLCKMKKNVEEESLVDIDSGASLAQGIDKEFCLDLINSIDQHKVKIFFHILFSPGGKFEPGREMFEHIEDKNRYFHACARVLVKWATVNHSTTHTPKALIQEALEFLQENSKVISMLNGNSNLSITDAEKSQKPQALYRLFYFLTTQMVSDEMYILLSTLRSPELIDLVTVQKKKRELYVQEPDFADMESLMEWYKLSHPHVGNIGEAFRTALQDQKLDRNDIVDHDSFVELLKYVDDNRQEDNLNSPSSESVRDNEPVREEANPIDSVGDDLPVLPDVPENEPSDQLDGRQNLEQQSVELEPLVSCAGDNSETSRKTHYRVGQSMVHA